MILQRLRWRLVMVVIQNLAHGRLQPIWAIRGLTAADSGQ